MGSCGDGCEVVGVGRVADGWSRSGSPCDMVDMPLGLLCSLMVLPEEWDEGGGGR